MRNKILSLLVLLLTAATGAWATDPDLENDYTLVKSVTWGDGTNIAGSGACAYTAYDTGNRNQQSLTILTAPEDAAGWIAMQAWTDGSGKGWWNRADNSLYCVNGGRSACVFGDDLTTGWLVVFECKNTASSAITLTNANSEPDGTFTYVASEDGKKYFCTITAAQNAYVGFCGIKNVQGITKISVYKPNAAPSSAPDVEVTTNAAEAGAAFTEATFTMPAFDATVDYDIVRDLTVQTQFYGVPTETVFVKKDDDKFMFADGVPTVALLDLLNQNAPIYDGVSYYFEKKNAETGEFEATTVNLLEDAQPGTWRIVTNAVADGPYDGTVRSDEFTLAEAYDLTLSPATNANLKSVTVGDETATPTDGVIKNIEPAKKVKITTTGPDYIIRKATVKKTGSAVLAPALENGATVVIICDWGDATTTFTYTNNGGTFSGQASGYEAEYFHNGVELNGKNLSFSASNMDNSEYLSVGITFNTESSAYSYTGKGEDFSSFTISVNGTDVTDQLTELK